ncbi:hypothetical protein C9I99_09330 [Photobacterium lutimaris]|uniref:Nucleoside recognition protein n=2 Tax=Photobacterium lutimaris TaxID=388278 RepID=A0A2T3IZS5_9GAMM|nr:hypothetical protein C9I99_09330 [Photobacterium lutimaris]TDR75762.1 hypothetical protein DFP78_104119 [Photobacterium lutimaris]
MGRVTKELIQLGRDIVSTTVSLFKIMIPVIILIKIADELGAVTLLGELLEPLMGILGLPSSMALVWATTMLTNLYAGLLVLINTDATLTVAQVTVLSSLLLISHGLPIEGMISKKAGVPMWAVLTLRIGGGVTFAWLQNVYYEYSAKNQHTAQILWQNEPVVGESYLQWAMGQAQSLFSIFLVIAVLITLLRLLKLLKIEQLMSLIMMPFLKILKVSKDAANLAVIGITLGLSYGGGLIINESKKGNLTAKDALITVLLLNLLHSIIEDTALVLLIGADLNMVLWARIVFSVCVMAIISHVHTLFSSRKEKQELHS